MDNPFAVVPRRSPFAATLKTLGVVLIGLTLVLGFQYGSQQWLLAQLTHELEQQPIEVQLDRLGQLSQLGSAGMEVLVQQLRAPEERVARAAFDLLKQQQQEWLRLSDAEADVKHRQLVTALMPISESLELRRTGWVAILANQTIVETVEHPSGDAAAAYQTATELLTKLTVSDREDVLVVSEPGGLRVSMRNDPLPLRNIASEGSSGADVLPGASEDDSDNPSPPSLDALPDGTTAELRPLRETSIRVPAMDTIADRSPEARQVIVPAQHLTDAPFETYTTRSVIAWLRSVQPHLRDAADVELKRRGLDEQQISLAIRLADPDIRVRLGLLNELPRRSDIDPRQWLLWLADDAEPDVRSKAIAALGTMRDAEITRRLNEKLPTERDPAVADLIRRILSGR